jgi:hypothetical protein
LSASVVATRWQKCAAGDERVDRRLGGVVLDWPEDRDRAAADGDYDSFAPRCATQLRCQILAQLSGSDSPNDHVYASVHMTS